MRWRRRAAGPDRTGGQPTPGGAVEDASALSSELIPLVNLLAVHSEALQVQVNRLQQRLADPQTRRPGNGHAR